ncbi:MAG: DUF2244 domain-containing protein [Casimicrobium sp.]
MSTNRLESVFEFRRSFATSRRQRLSVLAAIAAVSFAFALFLGWFVGAWLILPFAGIEVGCVALAFWWIERQSRDCDTVEVGDSSISITRIRGSERDNYTFSRAWVQIDIEQDRLGRERGVRFMQSGRSVSLAEFLRAHEQRDAAREIKAAIASPVWATTARTA